MKPATSPPPAAEPPADDREVELIKAAAQAWHGHSGNPRQAKESDPIHHRAAANGNGGWVRPSRFQLEAARHAADAARARWDFARSLWDSYEIVTISKRLESSMALDHPLTDDATCDGGAKGKRRKESKRSLRTLFQASPPGE